MFLPSPPKVLAHRPMHCLVQTRARSFWPSRSGNRQQLCLTEVSSQWRARWQALPLLYPSHVTRKLYCRKLLCGTRPLSFVGKRKVSCVNSPSGGRRLKIASQYLCFVYTHYQAASAKGNVGCKQNRRGLAVADSVQRGGRPFCHGGAQLEGVTEFLT